MARQDLRPTHPNTLHIHRRAPRRTKGEGDQGVANREQKRKSHARRNTATQPPTPAPRRGEKRDATALHDRLRRPSPKPSGRNTQRPSRRLDRRLASRGRFRNAAGAFQTWRTPPATLLKLKKLARSEEERRRLESTAPRPPAAKREPSPLLGEAGYEGVTSANSAALDLHDYQHHGPDPDMAQPIHNARRGRNRRKKLPRWQNA